MDRNDFFEDRNLEVEKDVGEFYHITRKLSNHKRSDVLDEAISGIYKHLMSGPDYDGLLKFLEFYSTSYLADPINNILKNHKWINYDRVYDLGAGRGWLGKCVAEINQSELISVDKRDWSLTNQYSTDWILNLEDPYSIGKLVGGLDPANDLVCMSEFLHCINNAKELLEALVPFPLLIVEYIGRTEEHFSSYKKQLARYSAINDDIWDWLAFLKGLGAHFYHISGYAIVIKEPIIVGSITK